MQWLTENFDKATFTPNLGWETTLAFLAMPIALVLLQSFTMTVLTPPPDENISEEEKEQLESSTRVLKVLPLMIGYFSLQVPAGLTIYWATSNVFTLLQSVIVKAYYKANPPVIELPDYWDALDDLENMSDDQRRDAAAAGISSGPTYEELMDEARFHYVVDREQIVDRRETTAAWTRIAEGEAKGNIPYNDAFKGWVNGEGVGGANGEKAPAAAAEVVEVQAK